jgi:hypothetical protein
MVSEAFVTAGHAIFTVSSPKGKHYTFKVCKVDPKAGSPFTSPAWFVHVLTGPNNLHDYSFIGQLDPKRFRVTQSWKSTIGAQAECLKVLAWALKVVRQTAGGYVIPTGYKIDHAGKCGRCGRTLTVPQSIECGIGPECQLLMGVA